MYDVNDIDLIVLTTVYFIGYFILYLFSTVVHVPVLDLKTNF